MNQLQHNFNLYQFNNGNNIINNPIINQNELNAYNIDEMNLEINLNNDEVIEDDIGRPTPSNMSRGNSIVNSNNHDLNNDVNQSQMSDGTLSLGAGLNKMNEMLFSGVTGKIKKNNEIIDVAKNINNNEDISMAIFAINNIENNNNGEMGNINIDDNFNLANNNDLNFGLDNQNINNVNINNINNLRVINNMNLND